MIPSLRLKLVLLYALIVAFIIAGFSVALRVGLERSLLAAFDTELETRARAVSALAEYENDEWFVEEKSGLHEEFAESRGIYHRGLELGIGRWWGGRERRRRLGSLAWTDGSPGISGHRESVPPAAGVDQRRDPRPTHVFN